MAARKHAITEQLQVRPDLIAAVRQVALARATQPGWDKITTEWSDQDLQQVIGRSTTARGAVWQVTQAVKTLREQGTGFVYDGRQMDQAVQSTVQAAEFEQACRKPVWEPRVDYAAWYARQPLALPAPARKPRKRDYRAEYARQRARKLQAA